MHSANGRPEIKMSLDHESSLRIMALHRGKLRVELDRLEKNIASDATAPAIGMDNENYFHVIRGAIADKCDKLRVEATIRMVDELIVYHKKKILAAK